MSRHPTRPFPQPHHWTSCINKKTGVRPEGTRVRKNGSKNFSLQLASRYKCKKSIEPDCQASAARIADKKLDATYGELVQTWLLMSAYDRSDFSKAKSSFPAFGFAWNNVIHKRQNPSHFIERGVLLSTDDLAPGDLRRFGHVGRRNFDAVLRASRRPEAAASTNARKSGRSEKSACPES